MVSDSTHILLGLADQTWHYRTSALSWLRLAIHGSFFFPQSAGELIKNNWTDSTIHTSEVDGGILPAMVLYSDSGDSSAGRIHWSALQPTDISVCQFSLQHQSRVTFAKSMLERSLNFYGTGNAIDVLKFGRSLLIWLNFDQSIYGQLNYGLRQWFINSVPWHTSVSAWDLQVLKNI